MASSSYTEDLSCSICLAIFTDPVSLLCGHSFCRECVTHALSSKAQCPHCQMTVPTEEKYLPTNYILRSLAEKAKAGEAQRDNDTAIPESLCPEHEEKLKLFCETDQQLACVICRDGKRHDGHKFKPIREAAESLRQQLGRGITTLTGYISAVESTASRQKEAISAAQKKSQELKDQISTQFEEMHQFLRKREDGINADLEKKQRQTVEKMSERLKVIDEAIAENREVEAKVRSALEISDPQGFLQRWSDDDAKAIKNALFSSRAEGLQVSSESFSLGPYESHLQFFVWKEMLQVVQPLPERLSLNKDNIRVSNDGRSLLCISHKTPQNLGSASQYCRQCSRSRVYEYNVSTPLNYVVSPPLNYDVSPPLNSDYPTSSTKQFSSGQHYWEVEVGQGGFWEVGIQKYFLKKEAQIYYVIYKRGSEQLPYTGRPRKIGVYLNCSSRALYFYNADTMELIHTMPYTTSPPQAAYFNIRYSEQPNPLTVCWY